MEHPLPNFWKNDEIKNHWKAKSLIIGKLHFRIVFTLLLERDRGFHNENYSPTR